MSKVMIVTGASRGIGAAVARVAGQRGYWVCVNYVNNRAAADAVVADIERAGGKALAIGADVSVSKEATDLFRKVDEALGTVDVLVNNAGIIIRPCRADAMDPALLERVFAVNTFGVFYCTREAVKRMSTRNGGKGGVIVQMSSSAARHGGVPEETHYAASKGAIDSMTIGLAKEIGKEGIRVNAMRPGMIATEIHDVHGGGALVKQIGPTVPIGREGTAEEVAEVVLWLASDAASYVHGAIIDVSGGR
jgi:NAD(P)-dependent dehydrogenase (short-subunit alcohol dehydrogenase family)